MPAFTGLLQVATTHLLLKYGMKAAALYQEEKSFDFDAGGLLQFVYISLACTKANLWG